MNEGIGVRSINPQTKAIVIGNTGIGQKSILFDQDNPPPIKGKKIYSVAQPEWSSLESNSAMLISAPINGGPNKRRNNKTLLSLSTFYNFFQKGEPAHFGGEWSVIKGNPKVLAQVTFESDDLCWSEALIVMSPSDMISVTYHKKGVKSFILAYEKNHRHQHLSSHDSHYYITTINVDSHPKNDRERRLKRKIKEARRASYNGKDF